MSKIPTKPEKPNHPDQSEKRQRGNGTSSGGPRKPQ